MLPQILERTWEPIKNIHSYFLSVALITLGATSLNAMDFSEILRQYSSSAALLTEEEQKKYLPAMNAITSNFRSADGLCEAILKYDRIYGTLITIQILKTVLTQTGVFLNQIKNKNSWTPLHSAAASGYQKVVTIEKIGHDKLSVLRTVKNADGKTAFDLAQKSKIRHLLQSQDLAWKKKKVRFLRASVKSQQGGKKARVG